MKKAILLLSLIILSFLQLKAEDYTFGYWLNGWRKNPTETSKDIFGIETNQYGFTIDISDFKNTSFGKIKTDMSYADALQHRASKLSKIPKSKLNIQLEINGDKYIARSCRSGLLKGDKRLGSVYLYESGRYFQHYKFLDLDFRNSKGERLQGYTDLSITAWPNAMNFQLDMEPVDSYKDGIYAGLQGKGLCISNQAKVYNHKPNYENEQLTLETWVKIPKILKDKNNNNWIVCKNGNENQDGFFGIKMFGNSGFTAVMNVGGGASNKHKIDCRYIRGLKLDQWNHIVLTYDGKLMKLFFNGRKVGVKEINKTRVKGTGLLVLGNNMLKSRLKPFHGILDNVRIWSKALTDSDVRAIHSNQGKSSSSEGVVFNEDFENFSGEIVEAKRWDKAKVSISIKSKNDSYSTSKTEASWGINETKSFSLAFDINKNPLDKTKELKLTFEGEKQTVSYDSKKLCYFSKIDKVKRKWESGYTDIRNYDEFDISVPASSQKIPFLLHFTKPANITGLCPILCFEDGTPTGIQVQLSKNWHDVSVGSYLMAYVQLPKNTEVQNYKLRLAYGFYGKLPSATHSQLSLVGYGNNNNGRWDQLAIGCFGETICFDIDQSCVENTITDIRGLMLRNGRDGRKWSWTNCGWGGDWIIVSDKNQQKFFPKEQKTAYLTQGPCLTNVKYSGFYGANQEITYDTRVQTLRTDDYSRTFQTFTYKVQKSIEANVLTLFKLGRTSNYHTPTLAYGNKDGLTKEISFEKDLKLGQIALDKVNMIGKAPFWVSFHGGLSTSIDGKGLGYKSVIVRKYKAIIGGKTYLNPSFTAMQYKGKDPNIDFHLLAPKGIKKLIAGDIIEFEVELITLPNTVDYYYGPNESFVKELQTNPKSWKTTYREVKGNNLNVTVRGGVKKRNYPIEINVLQPKVSVNIKGGVGAVPITFSGLTSPRGYGLFQIIDGKEVKFDQSVHGNDFWQTEYEAQTKTYKITYNLELDKLQTSSWLLKKI